jgi:hypothetical protein
MEHDAPAFPHLRAECQTSHETEMYEGVTKRELAAMFAMAGMGANPECAELGIGELAHFSVKIADALLAALKEEKP